MRAGVHSKIITTLVLSAMLLNIIVVSACAKTDTNKDRIYINSEHIRWIEVRGKNIRVNLTTLGRLYGVIDPYGLADEIINVTESRTGIDFPWSRDIVADEVAVHCFADCSMGWIPRIGEHIRAHTDIIDIDGNYPFRGYNPAKWLD